MKKNNLEGIGEMIHLIRGQRVMLDSDLAGLYNVQTSQLNRQVRRNIERFPEDFMFQLNKEEVEHLRCQKGITKQSRGGSRVFPLVFSENGVAMLSSVLRSPEAIQINIKIMRIFTRHRSYDLIEQDHSSELKNLKSETNKLFRLVFERLDTLEEMIEPRLSPRRRKIGLS